MVQEIFQVNSQNKYIIPNHQSSEGKERIKRANKCENKEWKEIQDQGIGRLWMHIHKNQQTTGQRQEDPDKTNKLLI